MILGWVPLLTKKWSGDSWQNHNEIWARALLQQHSWDPSNPMATWTIFSQLHRFQRPREPSLRLSQADISQAVLKNLQVQPGNRHRCRMSLKALETRYYSNIWKILSSIQNCCPCMLLQNLLDFIAIIGSLASEDIENTAKFLIVFIPLFGLQLC